MSVEQARSKYRRRMHLKIIGVLVVAASLYALLKYQQQAEFVAAESWPSTAGEITSSEVGLAPNSTGKVVTYEHKIQYRYEIGDQHYYGNKHMLHGRVASIYREDIESKVASLPLGTKVTVFYEPGNESNAVLIR